MRDGAGVHTQIFLAPKLMVLYYVTLAYLRLIERQKSHSFIADSLGKRAETNRLTPT